MGQQHVSAGFLAVKNFADFQHYRDRSPAWIKLYTRVLEDYDFLALSDTARSHLLLIWTLASRVENKIPNDRRWVTRAIGAKKTVDLDALIDGGWLIPWTPEAGRGKREEWASRYVSEDMRVAVLERDGYACRLCGATENLEIDHVVPISRGGTGEIENLQVLCRACNRRKRSSLASAERDATQTGDICVAEPRTDATAPRARGEGEAEERREETTPHSPARGGTSEVRSKIPEAYREDFDRVLLHVAVSESLFAVLDALNVGHPTPPAFTWEEIGLALRDLVANGKHQHFNARQFRRYVQSVREQVASARNGNGTGRKLTIGEKVYLKASGGVT